MFVLSEQFAGWALFCLEGAGKLVKREFVVVYPIDHSSSSFLEHSKSFHTGFCFREIGIVLRLAFVNNANKCQSMGYETNTYEITYKYFPRVLLLILTITTLLQAIFIVMVS